jgi:hypothetical protein
MVGTSVDKDEDHGDSLTLACPLKGATPKAFGATPLARLYEMAIPGAIPQSRECYKVQHEVLHDEILVTSQLRTCRN